MHSLIGFIPALPILGFLILALFGKNLSHTIAAMVGVGGVALSAILTLVAGIDFLSMNARDAAYSVTLWQWINAGGFTANIVFRLDALSLVFIFVITFVGSLILIYSIEFMANDEGFFRFFAYMNLFVGSMLILVMADNLLLLYFGWEGVGLCSFLLIGFWYKDTANGDAARKAFIVTRIGDTAMIIGLFLLYINLGTLNMNELSHLAPIKWVVGSPIAVLTAALLLAGALGKSA